MCGIAGFSGEGSLAIVKQMCDLMAYRGPDDFGSADLGRISFGQRRLSINDLAGGHQPILNESGRLALVCNGEIYNSPDLRRELLSKGHAFKTATDVEVILHLYEEVGDECVKRLRGMFAFALWDGDRQRLLLARDHMGQKPLFYATRDGEIAFASEPKGVLVSGIVRKDIDLEAL